jgi:hypothetical protein
LRRGDDGRLEATCGVEGDLQVELLQAPVDYQVPSTGLLVLAPVGALESGRFGA